MNTSLNIVELIENNPITKLSNTYQSNLLNKIKTKFNENEQQMFVASFYCYLNYDSRNDFVIDLDNVWKWLEFSTKQKAKDLLEKNFIIDNDYKILLNQQVKQKTNRQGGHNKEKIMLNIKTFKMFCLKAGTKKSEQIHEYYINLEETLQEVIQEESNELKLQLEKKTTELQNQIIISDKDKDKIREKTILDQFPNNTQCVYYGIIDNLSNKNEKLVKFGNSNNLKSRVRTHKDTYLNFRLINAFKVGNKLQIENAIKENVILNERQRSLTLNNKKYIELLSIDGINFNDLDKLIKEIITGIEYSPENYIKLLETNKLLKKQLDEKIIKNDDTNKLLLLTEDNNRLKNENIKLFRKYNTLKKTIKNDYNEDNHENDNDENEIQSQQLPQNDINNYGNVLHIFKRITKVNGTYNIDGKIYEKLIGLRQEVIDEKAYKTSGSLLKDDLMVNRYGKVVSKKKYIQEKTNNRFTKFDG